jgi:hypothetical protein
MFYVVHFIVVHFNVVQITGLSTVKFDFVQFNVAHTFQNFLCDIEHIEDEHTLKTLHILRMNIHYTF